MTPDLHAAATTLAADLATLHRAGRIAGLYVPGMRVNTGGVSRRWNKADASGAAANLWWHSEWTRPDLIDPLTVQGVVLLAREAWGDPEAHLALGAAGWVWLSGESRGGAAVVLDVPAQSTEALAACAAIRAAAAGVGT